MAEAAPALSPATIDFRTQHPEALRGVRLRHRINWEALDIAIGHSCAEEVSQLKQRRMRKQMMKRVKEVGVECLYPAIRYNYCRARLTLGDFSDYWGWEFRDFGNNGESWAAHMYWEECWLPKWGGGNCNRVLVLGEQGVGDAIFAASMLPEVMCRVKEVIFECDERLHTLLERSLPGLQCRAERKFEDRRPDYGLIDAFIPSFELMRMFRRDRRAWPGLPYLKPDPARAGAMEKYRGRTGVAWKGRQGSIDPMTLGIENPLSLQYKDFHREIEQPAVDLWHDIEGIVALCSVLERAVTVPTSVHHMAGALGKRTEIIVPNIRNDEALNLSPWDYSTFYNGGKILWYPDAQVFDTVSAWRSQ